jgi:hypothetical protein
LIFTSIFKWITRENFEKHNERDCDINKLWFMYKSLQDIDREVSALTDVYLLTFLFLDTITDSQKHILAQTSLPVSIDRCGDLHAKYQEFLLGLAKALRPLDSRNRNACPPVAIVEQMHHICADYMRTNEFLFNPAFRRSNDDKAIRWMWYVSFSLAPLTHLHFELNDFSQDGTNPSIYMGAHTRYQFSSWRTRLEGSQTLGAPFL